MDYALHPVNLFILAETTDQTLTQSKAVLERIVTGVFNIESVVTFIFAITVALILGRLVAMVLRRLTYYIGSRVDKTDNQETVTKLRRFETLVVLSIAIARTLLVAIGVYFWWSVTHPHQQPTALLGAGAVVAILVSGSISPLLRDVAYGAGMMAEHWYGVGDHIIIDPMTNGQGIVERVTLRSTKIRGVNGEAIWINNQNITAVHVTPQGLRTLAVELFVSDVDAGGKLVENANLRLPIGPLMVVSPLHIMTQAKITDKLWNITAVAEVAPGREWFIDQFAIDVLCDLDNPKKGGYNTLAHKPISRFADSEAERRFAKTIKNARKPRSKPQSLTKIVASKRAANKRKELSPFEE